MRLGFSLATLSHPSLTKVATYPREGVVREEPICPGLCFGPYQLGQLESNARLIIEC